MVEQMFENEVSVCVGNFLKTATTEEIDMLKRTDIVSRDTINEILQGYEKTNGNFFDEISELDYQISRRVSKPTVFLAEMFQNNTLKVPSKWKNTDEVARTILSLSAESESSGLRKEQIIFRDEAIKTSNNGFARAQKINCLTSFQANLRQPKSPTAGESPGRMQI